VTLDTERVARAVCLRIAEPGDHRLASLVETHGAAGALEQIRAGRGVAERWLVRLPSADGRADLDAAAAAGARLVVPGDLEWPTDRVEGLLAPPLGLYVRGSASLRSFLERSVAVVGSRASTAYGEHVAAEIAADLAAAGWTVVSGGAYGIDGAAHRAALAVGGRSVAILANGIDQSYPRGHVALLSRIAATGLLVTELPPGEHPSRSRFLERNRLIAALTLGTVAVEMALRSGAATTVDRAHELGRVHMAVPGPVTSPMSAGCHHWISSRNASLVTSAADVLALVAPYGEAAEADPRGEVRPTDALAPEELRLFDALPVAGSRPLAELAGAAGIAPRDLAERLDVLLRLGLATCDGTHVSRTTRGRGA